MCDYFIDEKSFLTPTQHEERDMKLENLMKLRYLIVALAFAAGVSGCATIEGAGEDIQSAGEAIEEGAEEASN